MNDKVVNIDLLKFKLFTGLKPADIEYIKEKLVCRIRRYSPNQIIAERGEEMESLMLLLDGELIGEM
jgi:CRP-like cAMP-binding protein